MKLAADKISDDFIFPENKSWPHETSLADSKHDKRAMMALYRSPEYDSTIGEYDLIRGWKGGHL